MRDLPEWGELCVTQPSVGLSGEAASLPHGSSQLTTYCTECFLLNTCMEKISRLRFIVENIKTELFTTFQYHLHKLYINTYLIIAVKIFLERYIYLVSFLFTPGRVQVISSRDIRLCCLFCHVKH